MKFNYNEDVSRILDYLIFPRIYYFVSEYKNSHDDTFVKVIDEQYLEFAEKMRSKLEPSSDDIKTFYQDDIYSNNDFYNILINAFPVHEYENEHQYLDELVKIDELTFKEKIIHSLLNLENESAVDSELALDENSALQYINELKIDASNKWNLLMIIQKPKEQLKKFIELLNQYESLFYDYHKQSIDQMNLVGKRLESMLSKNTKKSFDELTYHSIDYDFNSGECGYIYVSSIFPYTMRISEEDPLRIVWGVQMEKSFKRVHEIIDDQLTQRVKVFKALGDKTRYETLKLLSQGVSSIKQIAQTLDVSSATISYHINEFLTSGIVHIRRGKETKSTYQVDYERLNLILKAFKEDLKF
jgi:DNA-binding transcriptional ArsR family regulator